MKDRISNVFSQFFIITLSSHLYLFASETSQTQTQPPQSPVHFKSDYLEYQESQKIITASGNVTVQQSSYTFYSDHAVFNIPKESLDAWGHVRFSDIHGNELRARFLTYGIQKGSAKLLDAEGSFGPWNFAAKEVIRDQDGNFFLEKSKLSTCESDLSRYHLYGLRIKILPQKRLTVQHALLRVGPVPILYFPYYYYSLGEKHLAFQIFPGKNQSEGVFVRTVWGYPITDEIYGRLYMDHLTKRGIGSGGEIDYYFGHRAKGNVYGFFIDDRVTRQKRWNARLSHWQQVLPRWIMQTNINQLSDDSFPNDFFREDFNRVVRDLRSSLAFTYQRNLYFLRLFGERSDLFDPIQGKFFSGEIFAPKIEFHQLQSPLGFLGLEKTIFFSLANRFAGKSLSGTNLSRQYRRESDGQLSVFRQIRLSNKTNFVPKISLKNQWIDRPQTGEFSEPFTQKIETESTLRQMMGRFWDIDLTYLFSQRLQNNQGADQGRENHFLSFFSLFRLRDRFLLRFETAYNLPRFKGEPLPFSDRKKYRPLRAEIFFTPRKNLEFFFKEEYTLFDSKTGSMHPESIQSEILWGERVQGKDYFLLGTNYFSSRDHVLELRQSGRFSPWGKWHFEGTLRTLFFYRGTNFFDIEKAELFEKEVLVKKEWRCWELSFTFRERAGVFEFLFNLELKLNRLEREKSSHKSQESEWYPWREWK